MLLCCVTSVVSFTPKLAHWCAPWQVLRRPGYSRGPKRGSLLSPHSGIVSTLADLMVRPGVLPAALTQPASQIVATVRRDQPMRQTSANLLARLPKQVSRWAF